MLCVLPSWIRGTVAIILCEANALAKMVNENYEPGAGEKVIIELITQGRNSDRPWGRVNPLYIRENSNLNKGQVEYALKNLTNAGWIEQINKGGLYEFVEDPREKDN